MKSKPKDDGVYRGMSRLLIEWSLSHRRKGSAICIWAHVTYRIPAFLKPHSHCAGVATVHPDAGQPVYRDAPGHIFFLKIKCVLTLPTLPRYSPGPRESKTPVESQFTTEHLRCSTGEPRFMPVYMYPGVTQVVYGDVPVTVTTGCATVTCR